MPCKSLIRLYKANAARKAQKLISCALRAAFAVDFSEPDYFPFLRMPTTTSAVITRRETTRTAATTPIIEWSPVAGFPVLAKAGTAVRIMKSAALRSIPQPFFVIMLTSPFRFHYSFPYIGCQ
jgi:hypothetical protein